MKNLKFLIVNFIEIRVKRLSLAFSTHLVEHNSVDWHSSLYMKKRIEMDSYSF